jgi:tetratricopeptide (TPR) repeat protein
VNGQNKSYVNKYDTVLDPLFDKGKGDEIVSFLEKKLKSNPKDVDALRYLAYTHLHLTKKIDLVRKYYNEALAITPNCSACFMNIGISYLQENDEKKAIDCFDKAIRLDPENAYYYGLRGKLKSQLGQNTSAFMDLNKAVELSPNDPDMYAERSKFNSKCGYFFPAISDINKAIELCPKERLHAAYFERSEIYSLSAKYTEAIVDLDKAIELDSTIALYYFARGNVNKYLDSTNKSIADFKTAIRRDSNDFRPYVNLTHLLCSKEDMDLACDYAKRTYNVLIRVNADSSLLSDFILIKEDICDITRPSYYYHRAIASFMKKNINEAEKLCNLTLEKFPGNYFALNSRGDSYYYTGKYQFAITDYSTIFSRSPKSLIEDLKTNFRFRFTSNDTLNMLLQTFKCSTHMNLAQCQIALGNLNKAMIEIDSSINLMIPLVNEKEFPFEVKGTILLMKGRYFDALQIFDTCIKLNHNSATDYVNRAVARIGLFSNAKLNYISAIRKWPTESFYAEWIFPTKLNSDPASQILLAALEDCDKAIDLNKNSAYAYFVKAQVKKMMKKTDYCEDFLKAKSLGYPVDQETLSTCSK